LRHVLTGEYRKPNNLSGLFEALQAAANRSARHTQRFGELGQGRPCIPVQGAEQPAIQIVHDCFSFRLSECHFEHFAVFSQAITRV
jgi:hypothetical protein